jgi:hypothetical protein
MMDANFATRTLRVGYLGDANHVRQTIASHVWRGEVRMHIYSQQIGEEEGSVLL